MIHSTNILKFAFVTTYRDVSSDPDGSDVRLKERFKAAFKVSKCDRFGHSTGVWTVVHLWGDVWVRLSWRVVHDVPILG